MSLLRPLPASPPPLPPSSQVARVFSVVSPSPTPSEGGDGFAQSSSTKRKSKSKSETTPGWKEKIRELSKKSLSRRRRASHDEKRSSPLPHRPSPPPSSPEVIDAPDVPPTPKESDCERRYRKERFHLIASKIGLSDLDPEEAESDYLYSILTRPIKRSRRPQEEEEKNLGREGSGGSPPRKVGTESALYDAKLALLRELASCHGDTREESFQKSLEALEELYAIGEERYDDVNINEEVDDSEGTWLTLSRPMFPGLLGRNLYGEAKYTLGTMSFGVFRPSDLVCSLQGTFNDVRRISGGKKVITERDREAVMEMEGLPESLKGVVLTTYE